MELVNTYLVDDEVRQAAAYTTQPAAIEMVSETGLPAADLNARAGRLLISTVLMGLVSYHSILCTIPDHCSKSWLILCSGLVVPTELNTTRGPPKHGAKKLAGEMKSQEQ